MIYKLKGGFMSKSRMKAIKILELIAYMFGNENMFDSKWFSFEDAIERIISRKGEKIK